MAVASMVLGIIALVLFCMWYLSIPCAIVAIVLGVIARGKAQRGEAGGEGKAKAGLICGIIALALDVVVIILAIVGVTMFGDKVHQEMLRQQQLQNQRQTTPTPQPAPTQSFNLSTN